MLSLAFLGLPGSDTKFLITFNVLITHARDMPLTPSGRCWRCRLAAQYYS
jgi:hypothetical protein